MSELKQEGPFYASESAETGLRFTCTRCSACCRFDSGFVWLSNTDLSRLSDGLGLAVDAVLSGYCRVVDFSGIRQLSLAEQPNMDCIFWTDGACSIYEHRPLQCRSFPFWAPFLGSRDEWNELETMCPGVNVGEVHAPKVIDSWLAARRREPPVDADSASGVTHDEG